MVKPCEYGIVSRGIYTPSCVDTYTAHYTIIDFPVKQKIMYPEFLENPIISNVTASSLSVALNISTGGNIYCLALEAHIILVSTSTIVSDGVKVGFLLHSKIYLNVFI